jgi:hypothetical protein
MADDRGGFGPINTLLQGDSGRAVGTVSGICPILAADIAAFVAVR